MTRYIIAMTRTEDSSQPFMYQAFKVSNASVAHDVAVPSNTLFFVFVTANVDTVEELLSSFMTIQIGPKIALNTCVELHYENPPKRYWVGKVISYEGCDYFISARANVLVPFQWLGENDVIIDM